METSALLSFSDDVKNRSWKDWLSAHNSFGAPLHRYNGTLYLTSDKLHYIGQDKKDDNAEFSVILFRHQIKQVYLGFDETFKMSESRGLGFSYQPIRIKIMDSEEDLYFITYSDSGFNTQQWFDTLVDWVS